jgi:hypothetical protein
MRLHQGQHGLPLNESVLVFITGRWKVTLTLPVFPLLHQGHPAEAFANCPTIRAVSKTSSSSFDLKAASLFS